MEPAEREWQSWVQRLAEGENEVVVEFWQLYGDRLQRLAAQNLTDTIEFAIAAAFWSGGRCPVGMSHVFAASSRGAISASK